VTLRYLSRRDVEATGLSMPAVIEAVEEGFRLKGLGRTQMPPKTAIHPAGPQTFLHAMPAAVGEPINAACVKWVGGAHANRTRGLPTLSGLIILNDPVTMLPLCVMDCTLVTALRTGAASAVAAKYLGPREATQVAVLGCGVQGRSNLQALAVLYPTLERCLAWDPDADALAAYVREMSAALAVDVLPVGGPEQAVRGSDVIVTAGPSSVDPTPYIPLAWLKPSAMAAPVDYDAAWLPDALNGVDRLVTDDLAQMEYHRGLGYFRHTPQADADLGQVVAGLAPGRERDDERTMSICLGIAVDDCVTARLVYDAACSAGIGVELPL
jgi:ornithine cyclodeaminase/alanine dehydrogenase